MFSGTRLPTGEAERCRAEAEVARVAMGDRQALANVYARYSHGIYGYIHSIVADRAEAEDITQQVFLKLMTACPRPDRRGGDFGAWLLRVARNAAIDSLRRSRRTLVLDPHEWAPARAAPDTEAGRDLEDALRALSRSQRDVVLLREVLGLSPREAAERLGKTDGAVHMLHHRGRKAMCERLAATGSRPCTRGRRREAG